MKKSNLTQLLSKVLCIMPNIPLMPDLWVFVPYRLNNNVRNNTIYIIHDLCRLLYLTYTHCLIDTSVRGAKVII